MVMAEIIPFQVAVYPCKAQNRNLPTIDLHPPPLYKKNRRATVPSHPRGNVPQVMVPPPPPAYYARDKRHEARQAGHMSHSTT